MAKEETGKRVRRSIFALLGLLGVLTFVAFIPGCGGGKGIPKSPPPEVALSASQPKPSGNSSIPQRNVLTGAHPVLSSLSAGTEFNFVLKAEFRDEVFQGSGRILFDESVVSPVRVERGALIPPDAVFMVKLDTAGFVPFAFTRLPGESGISPGRGELFRVRFRLNSPPPANFRIRILNDPAFLQLRDRNRGRLSFDLATEVTPQ